jgi:hypothetical protein
MNIRKSLILSLTVAAFAVPGISSAASALNTESSTYQENSQSNRTRAEVVHELEVSRQDDVFIDNLNINYPVATSSSKPSMTRNQVIAELKTARQDGTFINNLSHGYTSIDKPLTSTITRAEVKRELLTMSTAEKNYRENLYHGS